MQHNGLSRPAGGVLSKFAKLVPPPNSATNPSAALQRALPKIAGLYRYITFDRQCRNGDPSLLRILVCSRTLIH